jgi:outer membrane protein TolC
MYSTRTTKSNRAASLGILCISLLLSACSASLQPVQKSELSEVAQIERARQMAHTAPLKGPLTLDEAMARAIKYNLDHRVKLMEAAVASGQWRSDQFKQLPKIVAEAGYAWRNEENIRNSTDSVTGLPSLANPSISSDREHTTTGLGFSWSVLDFGLSYFNAKQSGDKVLVANEQRRKAMHNLLQRVQDAYWKVASAQLLQNDVRRTIRLAERALGFARKAEKDQMSNSKESLRYQRYLLDKLQTLEQIDRQLSSARLELARLIGLPANTSYRLANISRQMRTPPKVRLNPKDMEQLAIRANPDLRIEHYKTRIAALESRKLLLRHFPGLRLNYGSNYDSDSYVINQHWNDAALQISFDLLGLLALPSNQKLAKAGEELADTRRNAALMATLSQVHIALQRYQDALANYRRASSISRVDERLRRLSEGEVEAETTSELDRVSAQTAALYSKLRRYQALAEVHAALGRLQVTLGHEPVIGDIDASSLKQLQAAIQQAQGHWHKLLKGNKQALKRAIADQPAKEAPTRTAS